MTEQSSNFNIREFCEKQCVKDIDNFLKKCEEFYALLTEVNKVMNLTRIQDMQDFWNKHIADSLAIASYFKEIASAKLNIADIGCGGGFPSVPLSLAFPNLSITAIDSTGKKTAFVDKVRQTLDIKNLTVVTGRANELDRKSEYQARFDIITARAVAEAKSIFNDSRNMLRNNGRYILYKTPDKAPGEMEEARKITAKFGFRWRITEVFELPGGNGSRLFLEAKK